MVSESPKSAPRETPKNPIKALFDNTIVQAENVKKLTDPAEKAKRFKSLSNQLNTKVLRPVEEIKLTTKNAKKLRDLDKIIDLVQKKIDELNALAATEEQILESKQQSIKKRSSLSAEATPTLKQNLANQTPQKTPAEQKLTLNYGGEFIYTPTKCYINYPKEKFKSKPRIVVYFHGWDCGTGGTTDQTGTIMDQVKIMRAKGDPVIIVMPQSATKEDPTGKLWTDFQDPNTFSNLIKQVEAKAGRPVSQDITISSFSGGWRGAGPVLQGLRQNDPNMYNRIKQLSLMDSAYDYLSEFVLYAKQQGHKLTSIYTPTLAEANHKLETELSGIANVTIKKAKSSDHLKASEEFGEVT